VPGRVDPATIAVALDPNASIAWLDRPSIVEIEHEGERTVIHVTQATGSIGQTILTGYLGTSTTSP
jgi:hypothetical protein